MSEAFTLTEDQNLFRKEWRRLFEDKFAARAAGTEEQKRRFLTPIAEGEALISYCLTEPGSGSDAAAMASRAQRNGDDYVIIGTKRFITGGGISKLYVWYAVTDPDKGGHGITAFVLDAAMPGFEIGKHEDKLGIRGSPTTEVICNDVRVPAASRLGEEGAGFPLALRALQHSRITIGSQALGIAQGAFDFALNYVQERHQFNQPIADFQGIQWMLADMAMQLEAARALVYTAAAKADREDDDLTFFSAAAKCFASDMAMKVTNDAVQLLGGYGYIRDFPAERMLRDARINAIYEGTNQIQRVVVARHLLGGLTAEARASKR